MRKYLNTGVPQLNIPSYNPYHTKNVFVLTPRMYRSSVNFTEMKVYGLTNYTISNAK